ncbi:MAG: response regulator [Sulfuricurvum sp.]|nr:response regulator [Sulfuricurvum sp.]
MVSIKELKHFSHRLKLLYVEDNPQVRKETVELFIPLFESVDIAADGQEGLEAYNNNSYDLVITDINMPRLNGIEMIEKIREIHPEQKIVAISAHDESAILLDLIRKGISSFILKPINLDEMIATLYPVCRDADTQNVNTELFEALQKERKNLKRVVEALHTHLKTVEIKNAQLSKISEEQNSVDKNPFLQEYFAVDEDQGKESVVFINEDAEEMKELLLSLPDELSQYILTNKKANLHSAAQCVGKLARTLYRYSPFLDPLAKNLEELSEMMGYKEEFAELLVRKSDAMLSLFDAVCIDLGLYVHRFTQESMAMRNIHHIHEPTSLSIRQIIQLVTPAESDDCGDIELF